MDRLIIENGGTHMKPTKILLIVAAGLSAVGLVIAGIGFSLGGFDFRNLTTRKTGTDKSQSFPLENVSEIYIDVRDQPVVIEHSPDDKLHILYREDEGDRYTIESDNGGFLSFTGTISFPAWILSFGDFSTASCLIPAQSPFNCLPHTQRF